MKPFTVLNIGHTLLLALFEAKYTLTVLSHAEDVLALLVRVGVDDARGHSRRECLCSSQILDICAIFFFNIVENLLLQHCVVELSSCPTSVAAVATALW